MADEKDHERRISRLEGRMDEVADDAAAARHLAAAGDRDIADLGVKVDAHRQAINALGLRVAGLSGSVEVLTGKVDALSGSVDALSESVDVRFGAVDQRFGAVDRRFDAVDVRFDSLESRVDDGFAATDRGFAEMRGRLDRTAAGHEQIVGLLTRLLDEPG